jgi:hypothetical protein
MRRILLLAAALTLCGCGASRDDQKCMANIWHMGVALQKGADAGKIGVQLQKIAEAHEKAFGYTIDKSGVQYVVPPSRTP